jgi:hypothetical protein
MQLPKTRRILNVFLASPNDVVEERAIAEEIVADLNKTIGRRLAWQVDLYKWEDSSPGYGRPQAKINDAVDGCQLFIGLLHERWGQPTGIFSSGFEEEYERARTRRKTEGEPEIWLFFKAVPPERRIDPGPHLAKVLEFRKTQTNLAEVLYKEVKDSPHWRSELQSLLTDYVLSLALEAIKPSESESPTATPAVSSPGGNSVEVSPPEVPGRTSSLPGSLMQLSDVCSLLSQVVASGEMEFSTEDEKKLHEFDVARVYLLAWTWMSSRFTADVLGTHEINLIYKHREKILPTGRESFELMRAAVLDDADLKPAWFFNRRRPPEGIVNLLSYIAAFDRNVALRVKALKVLGSAQVELPRESWPDLPLSDIDMRVRLAAYDYLASLTNPEALPFLQEIAEKEEDSFFAGAARDSALKLKLRLDPNTGVSDLIAHPELISDKILTEANKFIPRITTGILLKGIESSNEPIRSACIKELARRKELSKSMAEFLTKDSSLDIRALAFSRLVELGERLDATKIREGISESGLAALGGVDVDSIVLKVFSSFTDEQLLAAVDWYSVDGAVAYTSLATERFHLVSDSIRADVSNGFERFKEVDHRRLKTTIGAAADKFIQQWEEGGLNRFIASRFLEAAAQGIAAHAIPSDIALARQWLLQREERTTRAALDIISRFGDASDVEALLRVVKDGFDEIPVQAAMVALKLSPTPVELAHELVTATGSGVIVAAFQWLLDQPLEQTKQFFLDLLGEPKDANRVRAILCLSRKLSPSEMEQILKDYLARDTYFYNVVCWLDRILYSPAPLKEMFGREIDQVL